MSEFHEWRIADRRSGAPELPALVGCGALSVLTFEVLGVVVRGSVFWLIVDLLGTGVAIALWVVCGVLIERAVLFMFTGWRPPIGRVALAVVPGALIAAALRLIAHAPAEACAAAGLSVHLVVLWYLGSAPPQLIDEPIEPLGL